MGKALKLVSWNVNGLRAVVKKNFFEFLDAEKPDIVCLQETKCTAADVAAVAWPAGYEAHFNSAEKKGYSGTAILTRKKTLAVKPHIGVEEHDLEGRVLRAEFDDFHLVNVYVPNSKRDLSRLGYRQRWDRDFLAYLKKLEKDKPVVFCGDLNVAHTELDLANPKPNKGKKGFTDEEREGFQNFVDAGFVDTFRLFTQGNGHYSWWSHFANSRARNVGWRIDYVLVSEALKKKVKEAKIHADVMGSDHCPVSIKLDI